MQKKTRFLTQLLATTLLLLSSVNLQAQPRAKYVFYFIGDGMGVNQVNGAETFMAARNGQIGVNHLRFTTFPHMAFVTTYSATNGVTDSAAAGTALAAGYKTKNAAVGVLQDLSTPVYSIAVDAQRYGAAVGVCTSVSIDHATPAVFYAHEPNRRSYYNIGKQLAPSGFDFFAGSDFIDPDPKNDSTTTKDLYEQATDAGYVIARGYDDYIKKSADAEKMILFQTEEDSRFYRKTIPYKIDRTPANLSLEQITAASIDFLKSRNKDGFFVMIEGGMIDMACHANDGAAYVQELLDMDSCIQMAYDFYLQHPDSTLIVVTADHETGGLSLGRGSYELHMEKMLNQKISVGRYTRHLAELREKSGKKFTWDLVRKDLEQHFGFWKNLPLTENQEKRLVEAFEKLRDGKSKSHKSLYDEANDLSYAALRIMDEITLIGWQSGGHSNGYVGVYAVGIGAEQFHGIVDNTEIPIKIRRAAGW